MTRIKQIARTVLILASAAVVLLLSIGSGALTAEACEAETVKVTLNKSWDHAGNPVNERPTSAVVRLYASGSSAVATANLTASNGWSASYQVPKYDSSGKPIVYRVEEDAIPCYTPTLPSPDSADPVSVGILKVVTNCNVGRFYFTQPDTGGSSSGLGLSAAPGYIVAKKGNDFFVWTSSELSPTQRAEFIASYNAAAKAGNYNQIDISGSPVFFSRLGVNNLGIYVYGDGVEFDYPNRWSMFACGGLTLGGGLTFTVLNTYTCVPTVDITAKKLWVGTAGASAELDLYYEDGGALKALGQVKTVNAAGGWTASWNDLAERDYVLREVVKVSGEYQPIGSGGTVTIGGREYTVTYGEGENCLTATNTEVPYYTVTLRKVSSTTGALLPGAIFRVTDSDGASSTVSTGTDGTVSLSLPAGMYTLTELSAPTGYIKAPGNAVLTVYEGGVTVSGGTDYYSASGREITVKNTPQPPKPNPRTGVSAPGRGR